MEQICPYCIDLDTWAYYLDHYMKQMVMSRALYSAYVLLVIEYRESKQINTCKKYMTNDQLPQQKLLKSEIAPTGLVKVLATYLGIELSYLSQLAFNICFQGRENRFIAINQVPPAFFFAFCANSKLQNDTHIGKHV